MGDEFTTYGIKMASINLSALLRNSATTCLACILSTNAFAIPIEISFEEIGEVGIAGTNPASIGPFSFTSGARVVTLSGQNTLGANRDRWSYSPYNVLDLLPGSGFSVFLTDGGTFDFLSAYGAASHADGGGMTVTGYRDGLVTNQIQVCGQSCFVWPGNDVHYLEFNWTDLDRLSFQQAQFSTGWRLLDHLSFDVDAQHVPEPSTISLAAVGLLLIARSQKGRKVLDRFRE